MRLQTFIFWICCSLLAVSVAPAQDQKAEDAALRVASAFRTKTLASLDRDVMRKGGVRVVVEHSLADKVEDRTFRSFAAADRWLSTNGGGTPGRHAATFERCTKRTCHFKETGLLHNNLYLTSIDYTRARGRIYVRTIYILDGD